MKRTIAVGLTLLPLAACNPFARNEEPIVEERQESSRPETKNVVYRGTLLPLGASIYMEGTHRLELEDGRFILLEANGLLLDEYVNEQVEVFGATRATVEGGAIIMRVERVAHFLQSSSASSEETAMSSEAPVADADASSSVAVSRAAVQPTSRTPVFVLSSSPAVASAVPAAPSSAPPAAASSAASDPLSSRAAAMAKANMAASNWTQQYCSTHVEFCIPVHKNWYYVSFGATSSSLWHVELSSEEIDALGDGPITVVLHSGAAAAADGHVEIDGGTATGYRAWTNNRHFVISAPAALESAIRYITQELTAAPAGAAQ